jgi:hypothetical protein
MIIESNAGTGRTSDMWARDTEEGKVHNLYC